MIEFREKRTKIEQSFILKRLIGMAAPVCFLHASPPVFNCWVWYVTVHSNQAFARTVAFELVAVQSVKRLLSERWMSQHAFCLWDSQWVSGVVLWMDDSLWVPCLFRHAWSCVHLDFPTMPEDCITCLFFCSFFSYQSSYSDYISAKLQFKK